MKYPPKRKTKWAIAIPSSLISECSDLREQTAKVGIIGRAAAIFRVDEIYVYKEGEKADYFQEIICNILEYMECPQYLRKYLFPKLKQLKYVGILPPLRTPHHPLKSERVVIKGHEYREGVVIKNDFKENKSVVYVGLNKPVICRPFRPLFARVTVDVDCNRIVSKEKVPIYWGYEVFKAESLSHVFEVSKADLVIGTSRYGTMIGEILNRLKARMKNSANKILVIFGGPQKGIFDILREEGVDPWDFCDFIVNFAPHQGVKTIRTEEAVLIVLSILNTI